MKSKWKLMNNLDFSGGCYQWCRIRARRKLGLLRFVRGPVTWAINLTLSGCVAVMVIDTNVVKVRCDIFTVCEMEVDVSLRRVLCVLVAAQADEGHLCASWIFKQLLGAAVSIDISEDLAPSLSFVLSFSYCLSLMHRVIQNSLAA